MNSVSIRIDGVPEAKRRLARLQRPRIIRSIEEGVLSGARRLVPYIKRAAPRGAGAEHPLAGSVRARLSRREPMTALVGPTSRKAHLLIGGTRAHDITPRRARALRLAEGRYAARAFVSGIRPNDWPARGAAGHADLVADAIAKEL